MSITGLRQTIATSFLLFAVPYIIDKKRKKALILFALALTQHKSAILFGGFFFLPMICNKFKLWLTGSFALFPVMMSAGGAVAMFFIEDTRMEQYSQFLEEYEGAGAYYFAAFILLLAVCLLWKGNNMAQQNENNKIFMSAIALAVALTPLTMINQSNMRIVQYYSIFALIILPEFLNVFKNSTGFKSIHNLIFLFFVFYTTLRPIPYFFFWQ